MSYVLNNVSVGSTAYTPAATLLCPGSKEWLLFVRNAAVFYQLGYGAPTPSWIEERFLPPGTLIRELPCDAIRVRAAVTPAPPTIPTPQVTIDATAEPGGPPK